MTQTRNYGAGGKLVTASEIAQLAGVQPSAVSNWRKRFPDFPKSAGTAPSGGDLFRIDAVERWLSEHGRTPERPRRGSVDALWLVLDGLRSQGAVPDVVGALTAATAAAYVARAEADELPDGTDAPEEVGRWARARTDRLKSDQPELRAVLAPLEALDARSAGSLLQPLLACAENELAEVLDTTLDRLSRYGEFRTAPAAAELLARLAQPGGTVFDPTVGSAEFLIAAAEAADSTLDLYGQELNESAWRLARTRLLLRDISAQLELGNSLTEDRYPTLRADVILCDPPTGQRTVDLSQTVGDERWRLLGALEPPSPAASDFTWAAHVIHHLAPDGRGYLLLAAGSLFRGGPDARYRAELLRQGTIEAIVALPRRATTGATPVAFALWILRPPTSNPRPVLLIDASAARGLTGSLQSRLAGTIRRWRQQPEEFEPSPPFSTTVPVLELLAGDASLVPSRWLYQADVVDTTKLIEEVEQAQAALAQARERLSARPPRVTLVPTAEPPARVRVRDLVDLRVARILRPVRVKTEQYGDEGLPVWLPRDVREPWRRTEPPHFIDPALVDARSITEAGDIVLTTIGGIRTRVDDEGGHVLGTSLQALRVKPGFFDPYALAALLTSEQNQRLLTGSTIPRVNVLELEVPRLELEASARLGELLRALERELETTNALVMQAGALTQAVVDAVATGAARIATAEADHV